MLVELDNNPALRKCVICLCDKSINCFQLVKMPKKTYLSRNCKECRRQLCKEWKLKNKDKVLTYNQYYRKENRDELLAYKGRYWQQNKHWLGPKNDKKKWQKTLNTPELRMRQVFRSRLHTALKSNGKKFKRSQELLGCTYQELKVHIESQFEPWMNWGNFGTKGWVVDHIVPVCAFSMLSIEDQKKCFNYKNLRPMHWRANLQKGGKILFDINEVLGKNCPTALKSSQSLAEV